MTIHSIGSAIKRKEDRRFLTGKGKYVDDIQLPQQSYAYILRSPHAHAKIISIDIDEAKKYPGVIAIFTGKDFQESNLGGIPCGWQVDFKDGTAMKEPVHPVVCVDKVLHVGDQVAVIIAETIDQAKDAAEAIYVDYEELEAVINMADAVSGNITQIHEEAPLNLSFDWEIGVESEIDQALNASEKVVTIEFENNRLIPNAMEPRCAIAEFDFNQEEYTLHTTSQNPHVIRMLMGAFVLQVPEHKIKVIAPDVGGGFGSKIYHYAEEAIVCWCAKQIGRPVKWTAERSESFITDAHGRDHKTKAQLGLDSEGKFTALKVETLANLGAYLSTFAPCVPTYLHATLLAGCYKTPLIYANIKGVFTNTVPVDAYRGAGRPEASYLLERIVDEAAKAMNLDPSEIRQRNFIQTSDFPYQTPVALEYDIGDYQKTLDLALEKIEYHKFDERRRSSASQGKYRGIGVSSYIEACGIAPSQVVGSLGARAGLYESGKIRVHPTGSVSVFTGSHSHGQGHETTFAQLIADKFGIPFDSIDVVHGDTSKIPFGMGTYGSRSLSVGGAALVKAADKIILKAKKIASHLMEASEQDIEFDNGEFRIAGTDKVKTFQEISLAAYVPHDFPHDELEPGLEETAFYDPKNFTYPAGTHICELEIDPDTGCIEILDFVAVDDFGRIINPMIVDGQVHGGLAQGIGQAMLEQCVYDSEGQLLTGTYMDYAMPRASDLPFFKVDTNSTLCTHNPIGSKGCGEAGAIGSPPALVNAILNALEPLGIKHIEMPATPYNIWQAIQQAEKAA